MSTTFSAAQISATLSAIAYLGQFEPDFLRYDTMNKAIAETLAGGWQLVWGPATEKEDLAFVASNGQGTYAVVVRGTLVTRIEDLLQDKTIGTQAALPFTADAAFQGALISQGAVDVWNNINAMKSSLPKSGGGDSLLQFLQNVGGSPTLYVTGHSLGGQTAAVLAAWLQNALPSATVQPITLAAPTAGNAAFASGFDTVFGGTGGICYYNALDLVPRLWTVDGIQSIDSMFPGGPAAGPLTQKAVQHALNVLSTNDVTYVSNSPSQSLPGQVYSESGVGQFEKETLDQHSAHYYMYLLGIPLSVINALEPSWAPPSSGTGSSRSVA